MDTKFSLLVVDSDVTQVASLAGQLAAEGFEAFTAIDGESALLAFERHLPNMLLAASRLPGIDGPALCRAIKKRSENTFVPVILMSDDAANEKDAAYDAGADDFIERPIGAKELLARIRSLRKVTEIALRAGGPGLGESAYRPESRPADECIKAIADGILPGRKRLYRIRKDEQLAYVGVDGGRVFHARSGDVVGRGALEDILFWPAEAIESADGYVFEPNIDVDFGALVDDFLGKIDLWHVCTVRLPQCGPLYANTGRMDDPFLSEGLVAEVFAHFASPVALSTALRGGTFDIAEGMRTAVNLFYRGLLLSTAHPDDAVYSPPVMRAGEFSVSVNEREAVKEELVAARESILALQEEKSRLEAKLEDSLPSMERLLAERDERLRVAATQLAENEAAMTALKKRYAVRLKELATESGGMDSVIEQLSMDLQEAHNFAASLQHAKSHAETLISQLREEIGGLRFALEESQKKTERGAGKGAGNEASTRRLLGEIAELKHQLAESAAARAKLSEEARHAAGMVLSRPLQTEIATLKVKLADVTGERESLRLEVERARADLERLKSSNETEWSGAAKRLEEQLRERTAIIEQLERELDVEKTKYLLVERELADSRAKLVEAGEEQSNVLAQADDSRLIELERELESARQSMAQTASVVRALEQQAADTASNVEMLNVEIERAKADARRQAETLRLSEEEFLRKIAALEQQRDDALHDREAAMERLAAAEAERSSNSQSDSLEADRLSEEVALLKEALRSAEMRAEKLTMDADEAKQALDETKRNSDAEIFSLASQLSQARSREEELSRQLEASPSGGSHGGHADTEVAFLKAKLAETETAGTARIRQLEAHIGQLRAKLAEAGQAQGTGGQGDDEALRRAADEIKLLKEKLLIAESAGNRNTLVQRAQDQAEQLLALKTTLRHKEEDVARLQAELHAFKDGEGVLDLGQDAAAASPAVEELQRTIDALRQKLLSREEEIVDLTAKLGEMPD